MTGAVYVELAGSLNPLASGCIVAHAEAKGSSHADSPMSELFRQAGRASGGQGPRGEVQTLRSFVSAAIYRSKPNRHRGEAFRPGEAVRRIDSLVSIGRQCRGALPAVPLKGRTRKSLVVSRPFQPKIRESLFR